MLTLCFGIILSPQMFEKKHMDLHNERITKAQAKVDSSEPEFMHTNLGHTNPKRMEAERERQYDLDKVR